MTETKHNDELVKRADAFLKEYANKMGNRPSGYSLVFELSNALKALPKAPDAGFCDHCWRKRSEGEDICWECGNSSFVPHNLKAGLRPGEEWGYQGVNNNIPLNHANLHKAENWFIEQGESSFVGDGAARYITLKDINPYWYVWQIIYIYITGELHSQALAEKAKGGV